MSLRPTDDREYIRDAAHTGGDGNPSTKTDTTKVVAMSGGEGAALPPAGTMSREFTEVFGYLIRRFFGFLFRSRGDNSWCLACARSLCFAFRGYVSWGHNVFFSFCFTFCIF